MTTLYLLQMDCGDYYCEAKHPAGVYGTREAAEKALAAALELTRVLDRSYPDTERVYQHGDIREIDLDAAPQAR